MAQYKPYPHANHSCECIDKKDLEIGREYYGVIQQGVTRGVWRNDAFQVQTDSGIKQYNYPTGEHSDLSPFLPHTLMNRKDARFFVRFSVDYLDKPLVIHHLRHNLNYVDALRCASGMAAALGLKSGLPVGFFWLTVMPDEVEENIRIIEEVGSKQ